MGKIGRRYAFVLPRYGKQVFGGAETLMAKLAIELSKVSIHVEIFTTCALDNRSWENVLPPGSTTEDGIPIHRFLVNDRDLEQWIPRQISISEGMNLPLEDELLWMEHSVRSDELVKALVRREDEFDLIFFGPYLFGTTFWGALSVPEKAVLVPCLHDEHYAYTQVVAATFLSARGALFNALPEQHLAERLYGPTAGGVVGMGFVPHDPQYVADLEPFFEEDFQYLLYVGRKETGKNAQLLIDYFSQWKDQDSTKKNVKLVIVGPGSFSDLLRPDAAFRDDVIDLERVSERDKHRLIRHSLALVQLSINESFGIVLMESWLLQTPVIVHADCAVTRHFVREANGGLYCADGVEFNSIVELFLTDKKLHKRLALSGFEYTLREFSWRAVLSRFFSVTEGILALDQDERTSPL